MIQGRLEDTFKKQQRNRTDATMRREVTPKKSDSGLSAELALSNQPKRKQY
jgi:hypothetical protein